MTRLGNRAVIAKRQARLRTTTVTITMEIDLDADVHQLRDVTIGSLCLVTDETHMHHQAYKTTEYVVLERFVTTRTKS